MVDQALKTALGAAKDYAAWLPVLEDFLARHSLFYGHGTDNSADEAYWLVAALLDWDRAAFERLPQPALTDKAARIATERVAERVPLAYLLGEAWFAGLRFEVSRSVLIPRSPLAELIERGLEPWCRPVPGDRLLDIGTGSGCIAIALAHYVPDTRVDATELSPAAAALARANVARHGLVDRVQVHEADLFPSDSGKYRVIISNPPYVPAAELAALPAEYRHEPSMALKAGVDGLDDVRRILAGSRSRLTEDGVLIVELGNAADTLMAALPGFSAIWVDFEHGGDGVFVATPQDLFNAGF
jgi:ribosomal protein L3 glutamine methyltransferase